MPSGPTVQAVIGELVRHPYRYFIERWNWKSAAASAMLRAAIFFATTVRAGWRAALAAVTVEAAFRIVASGFYGVAAQELRLAQPTWLSALVMMVVLPVAIQAIELLLHWIAGTPNLWQGVAISTALAGLSSLFNWFAMRRGAFLVGEQARPFSEDLRRYPALLAEFLLAGPRWLLGALWGNPPSSR